MPRNVQTTAQLHSFHMLAKQSSELSKLGFYNTWTGNFQMLKMDLEKAEEPEIKLLTSIGSELKQENSRKTSTSAPLTMINPLAVFKALKEMGIPDHLTCLLWNLCAGQGAAVRTGHATMDWFHIGKGVRQGHPASSTYMQSTSGKMLCWPKHKLESRLSGEISITSDIQMTPPIWRKAERQ